MSSPLNPATVTAILGPTNTGKTHYAIERMLGRSSGVIGLPLRLLAREVYDKICAIKGPGQCALITGEEKIQPEFARYYVCTAEAMPQDKRFAFAAIDEIQLFNHPERGHIFTDRLLHMRGTEETLLLGAESARPLIRELLPDVRHETRDRFSVLTHSGPMKLTRLPKRSVIVAFSAGEVYALAELIKRFRGGAAIVMGGLSPRTRNAQADLYQSGDVDFLIATDAVGMGLNLDADHVAFASMRKFDGRRRRRLTPMEAGQIAGRAGRFRNDGTFGTTGDCLPMDETLVAQLENHTYEPLRYAEWRNDKLNFQSAEALLGSLAVPSPHRRLRRVAPATDEDAFEKLSAAAHIKGQLSSPEDVKRLWDICQIPDFRNLTIDSHVRLLEDIYGQLLTYGKIPEDFLSKRMARLDHTEGGVDILSARLAQIRTWTYCANKPSWITAVDYWINQTRAIEDRLSDALHERLTARFVDRRTSALLKGMGPNTYMESTIKDNGDVWVDDHKIGHLDGLSFKIDTSGSELEAKALQAAAERTVGPEINRRLTSICAATHAIFNLSNEGKIMWGGHVIGKIAKSGSIFNPDTQIIGGEMGDPNLCAMTEDRMRDFLRGEVTAKLTPLAALKELSKSEKDGIRPEAKGFAYQMLENDGHIDRQVQNKLVYDLDPDTRRQLREVGIVFGQYDVFLKDMLKPKPAELLSLLAAYGAGGDGKPFIPFAGVTSLKNEGDFKSDNFSKQAIARAGYRVCGPRIVRFDILNRLAALVRQAQVENGTRRFQVMQEMLALLGSTHDDMRAVLTSLGYKSEIVNPDASEDALSAELSAPVPQRFIQDRRMVNPVKPEAGDDAPEPSSPETLSSETPSSETPPSAADAAVAANPSAETPAKAAPPAKPQSKKKAPPPLNIYHHRETDTDGKNVVVENHEFWFMPFAGKPKRPGAPHKPKFQKKRGGPAQPKKRAPSKQKQKQEQRRIEDSPFAALMALKNTDKKD